MASDSAGGLGLVLALVPHDVVNVGNDTLKVRFFSSSALVSVFDDPIMPFGKRVVEMPLRKEAEVETVPAGA